MRRTTKGACPCSLSFPHLLSASFQCESLTCFRGDGRLEINNSKAERALHAVALGKNNYLPSIYKLTRRPLAIRVAKFYLRALSRS